MIYRNVPAFIFTWILLEEVTTGLEKFFKVERVKSLDGWRKNASHLSVSLKRLPLSLFSNWSNKQEKLRLILVWVSNFSCSSKPPHPKKKKKTRPKLHSDRFLTSVIWLIYAQLWPITFFKTSCCYFTIKLVLEDIFCLSAELLFTACSHSLSHVFLLRSALIPLWLWSVVCS